MTFWEEVAAIVLALLLTDIIKYYYIKVIDEK
jgi:hypothetical protein